MKVGYMDNGHRVKPDARRARKGFPPAALEARAAMNVVSSTDKAKRMLVYIKHAYKLNGNFPSVREIMEVSDMSSTSMVIHYMRVLEEQKAIIRTGGKYSRYTLPEVLEALKSL